MSFAAGLFGEALFAGAAGAPGGGGGPQPATTTQLVVTVAQPPAVVTHLRVSVAAATPATFTPLRVAVVSPGTSPTRWQPVVTIGGVDISLRLVGAIRIEIGEGEARIASFGFVPVSGVIQPADWVAKRVTIDFAEVGGANAQRLFTGVVDVPEYDITNGIARVDCTDQRQEVIANMPRAWLDAHIGGLWSESVSGPALDSLQYAEEQILSVPKAIDLDAWQRPRVTAWAAGAAYDTVTASDVVDGSLTAALPSRADLRNIVVATFEYRFPRLRSRTVVSGWHLTGDYRAKKDLPTKAMVEAAVADLPGWHMDGGIGYGEPPIGSVTWNGGVYNMTAEAAANLCTSWAARHRTRWVQTVTERTTITVSNTASVAALGDARDSIAGASVAVEYDASPWLDDYSVEPMLTRTTTGDESYDYGEPGKTDRAAADAALATLVARAQTQVRASHRGGRVAFDTALRADYDVIHTYTVDVQLADGRRVQATGKARAIAHAMDIDTGEATTTVDVAISGHAAIGVQPYDPPTAPAAPADPVGPGPSINYSIKAGNYYGRRTGAPAFNADTMIGFVSNLSADDSTGTYDPFGELYPVQFSATAPSLESAARNPIELERSVSYAVDVPQDQFEVTA